MGKCRLGMQSLFKLFAGVIMFRATVACAAVPDELDGLAGHMMRGANLESQVGGIKLGISTSSDSVSFVQPVEDDADLALEDSQKEPLMFSGHFLHALVASFSVIIVSELGDKTFFIAAIMSMRHSRLVIFTGAMLALGFMTILSAALGFAITIIPPKYTRYISSALFAFFGLKMLKEGCEMDPNEGEEELEEVQAELKKKEAEMEKEKSLQITQDVETGIIRSGKKPSIFWSLCSPVLLQACTLTFLAEWGDRSQLATILLASRQDVYGVTIGGIMGHALCTGLAVIGGRLIAQRISVRTVTIVGGIVFLIFAVTTVLL